MKKAIPAGDIASQAQFQVLLDEVRFHAPQKIRALHQAIERKVAKFAERLPTKHQRWRMKIAALAADDNGAPDGLRAAAQAKLKHLYG